MYKLLSSKVLLFAILIISIFGMNLEEGKGQSPCPDGFTAVTFTININGCDYSYSLCYKCDPTGVYNLHIKENPFFSPRPINPSCIPSPPISHTELRKKLLEIGTERIMNISCAPRPCAEQPKANMIMYKYSCWEWRTDANGNAGIFACTDGPQCIEEFEYCIGIECDKETPPNCWPVPVITFISSIWFSESGSWSHCPPLPGGNLPIPDPSNTPNWNSGCFKFKTHCDGD